VYQTRSNELTLICLSLGWIAGVFLGSIYSPSVAWFFIAILPLALLFAPHLRKTGVIACLCLLLATGGAIYYQSVLPATNPSNTLYYNETPVIIHGIVGQDPDVRDKNTRIRLESQMINTDGEWREIKGTALLYVPRYPEYNYGDVLEVSGELKTPVNFADFDYAGYLAKQSVYSIMFDPGIEVVARGQGNPFLEWLYALRHRMADIIAQILPEPQASLSQGMLLGLRGNIPAEVSSDFTLSGTTHILAISGMNLTIIAGLLVSLGQWFLGKRYFLYVWLALFSIWVYVFISGAAPSVIRAAIMASVFLLAELFGRQKNAAPALFLAGAVMLVINPQVLWDVSFQLSMLAMAGLVYIHPPLQELGQSITQRLSGGSEHIKTALNFTIDSLMITLAATLAVWPVTTLYFGRLSIVSPLATLMAIPSMPVIIIVGFLATVFGVIFLPLGQIIGWLAWFFLSYLLLVARIFARIPGASVEINLASGIIVMCYYLVMVAFLWLLNRWQRKRLIAQLSTQTG
jgi:competence protein ComEC